MCSKPEKSVQKLVQSTRTKIYAANLDELASILAGRFKGSAYELREAASQAIRRLELLHSRDRRGPFYESSVARDRRLKQSDGSSLSMAGASR